MGAAKSYFGTPALQRKYKNDIATAPSTIKITVDARLLKNAVATPLGRSSSGAASFSQFSAQRGRLASAAATEVLPSMRPSGGGGATATAARPDRRDNSCESAHQTCRLDSKHPA